MKRNYYLFSNGRLRRKQNTIFLEMEKEKKPIPIEDVEAFYAFGELDFNSDLIDFLCQNQVPIHFFNYYGYYSGSFYPREYLNSGFLLVKQVEHYTSKAKRLEIAKEFIEAASFNILKNLNYYNSRGKNLQEFIDAVEANRAQIKDARDVQELMGIEGRVRDRYYKGFEEILGGEYEFENRVKRPPDNIVNCLISFGNSMLYTTTLSELYRTQLNPTVSFLHEPGTKRFSLSLDLSEVFKPIVVDRLIFTLLNKGMIKPEHFEEKLNYCYLKENGRKIFVKEYDERMKVTIMHRKLERNVSYRRLIRLECYKLIKHLSGVEPYKGFKIWW